MSTAIWWIRRDLRLSDNPALTAAARHGRVLAVYLHTPAEDGHAALGAAARWWLHHSLENLGARLAKHGVPLIVRQGPAALPLLQELIAEHKVSAVYWNRQYAPSLRARDEAVKAALKHMGLEVASFNGSLLFEPWSVLRDGVHPYKVFTPFWKACVKQGLDQPVLPEPVLAGEGESGLNPQTLASLELLPTKPDWAGGLRATWQPGEPGAWLRLTTFIERALATYKDDRNRPDLPGTSMLSPHLAFGEISPRQIVRAVLEACQGRLDRHSEHFFSELGWREFSYHLLYHFPHTVDRPLDPRWEAFPWPETDVQKLTAWQRGQTGIPLVDAGMRELWHTGWMHNRVRMNAASLLVKNMLIPWWLGERWFWDTLVDADLANNIQGWQWTAGCGADAAPYFRIFNPVLQGERFDPLGDYIRRWVPELARLPQTWIHQPWDAPAEVRAKAGVTLGVHYPWPVVDLAQSRAKALRLYEAIKGKREEGE
ncbi:MAG: deoxyribodipyrimidine photo-lyase [Gammaproteobacteria bacterium]|nr:deoxyribodipyrimidine photo-lyase [Gammaproteobacteria bacterium]